MELIGSQYGPRRAAQWVHAELESGGANGFHVDDVPQVVDIGQHEVFLVCGRRLYGRRNRYPFHRSIVGAQQFVGPVLDPAGDIGVRRPAVGRVVLEAAVLGRIMRRCDDNAVREVVFAAAVVNDNGPRYYGRGSNAVILLNDGLDVIGGQDFERGALRRSGQRVGVLAHVERAVGSLAAPVVADGLGDGQDVRLGETCCAGTSRGVHWCRR